MNGMSWRAAGRRKITLLAAVALLGVFRAFADTPGLLPDMRTMSFSISPVILVWPLFAPSDSDIPGYLWLEMDVNFEFPHRQERSYGIYAEPDSLGIRGQRRMYFNENRTGFFLGTFGTLEYRKDFTGRSLDGKFSSMSVSQGAGLTLGGDAGLRLRGTRLGVTFYGGLGLPFYYCFGNTIAAAGFAICQDKILDLGIRIDFYSL
jgi:hypothetical protein